MISQTNRLIFLAVGLMLVFGCCLPEAVIFAQPPPGKPREAKSPDRVDEVLRWLPADTETVIVARGPFVFPVLQPDHKGPLSLELQLQLLVTRGLISTDQASFWKHLAGQKVALAVEGSRRYRWPNGLGLSPYEGCHITIFEDDLGPVGDALMERLSADASRVVELARHRVAVFIKKSENDIWTLFITQPKPNVLLCATNWDYLSMVLCRMSDPRPTRALPDELPEWKHVDRQAPFWALRHYDPTQADRDPTSPLRPSLDARWRDPGAIGSVFNYTPNQANVAAIKYLTKTANAIPIVTNYWHRPSDQLVPKIRQLEPGVIEVSVPLDKDETKDIFFFELLAWLGHMVAI